MARPLLEVCFMQNKLFSTRNLAKMAILAALGAALMFFEIPLPFAPSFYEIDFSEVPILIGSFVMGPVAGVVMEFVKIMLKLLLKGTWTFGVGDLGNFLIGCSFIVPTSIIYRKMRSNKGMIIACISGTLCLMIIGAVLNYFLLLPFYSQFIPIDQIIQLGAAVNAFVYDMKSLVLWAVVPFNALKGVLVSILTILLFKRVQKALT